MKCWGLTFANECPRWLQGDLVIVDTVHSLLFTASYFPVLGEITKSFGICFELDGLRERDPGLLSQQVIALTRMPKFSSRFAGLLHPSTFFQDVMLPLFPWVSGALLSIPWSCLQSQLWGGKQNMVGGTQSDFGGLDPPAICGDTVGRGFIEGGSLGRDRPGSKATADYHHERKPRQSQKNPLVEPMCLLSASEFWGAWQHDQS